MVGQEFFKPVNEFIENITRGDDTVASATLVHSINKSFPDITNAKIALIGVPEFRGAAYSTEFKNGNAAIREKFYRLKKHSGTLQLADLGDLIPGNTLEDTYFALSEILLELLKNSVIPVIIGGTQDLAVAQFNAYKRFEKVINIAGIDSRFDLGMPEEPLNSETWLGKIVLQQPNYLFNFSNIGYQTYFVGSAAVELMNKLYFDAYRVGQVRSDITEMEPVIRSADMMTVDIAAIRQSDAPGNMNPSPNGFTGEEMCQAMMYAGLNDRLTSMGIYDFHYAKDRDDQTAHLIAQMIWYFIEGVNNRKSDFPNANYAGFITYRVAVDTLDKDLVFLKHNTSGRWWMEVPLPVKNNRLSTQNYLPCGHSDYVQACKNEMPDRYWQALQKLT
jgi:formiminoglutamase